MKAELYNLNNEKVGELELPEEVFGAKWNATLVRQALLAQMANRRLPWAHAKTRGEVSGGGRKPWRQKGTGRARHGSIRSPLWVGGGKSHGPRNERDYSQKLNKKMKRLAILAVLSRKLKDGEVRFFESLALEAPKTKLLAGRLKVILPGGKHDVFFVPDSENRGIYRASRNLPRVKALDPAALNVYDLLNYKQVFVDRKAVPVIQKGLLAK